MRLAAGIATAAVALAAAEHWTRGTRASRAERGAPLPGDDLVVRPRWAATRAVTIRAPRSAVWPWLVQMGYPTHRAGWYTPFWMDRLVFGIRARSAETILAELQQLAVGDVVPDSDTNVSWFVVAALEPERALVLRSHTHPLPAYRDVDFTWAFALREVPEGTRLLLRARVTCTPVWPAWAVTLLLRGGFGLGDVLQAGAMLGGIRRRAERLSPAPARPRSPARGGARR